MMGARNPLRRFVGDRRGVAAIEFAMIAPVLVLLFLGCVGFFVLYRDATTAEKATFAIADMISRKTEVTTAQLGEFTALFTAIAQHPAADIEFRVSSLKRTGGNLKVDWSYTKAPQAALATKDIPIEKIPLLADGDSVIFVETMVQSRPLFDVVSATNLGLTHFSLNRPRFTAAVKKTD